MMRNIIPVTYGSISHCSVPSLTTALRPFQALTKTPYLDKKLRRLRFDFGLTSCDLCPLPYVADIVDCNQKMVHFPFPDD